MKHLHIALVMLLLMVGCNAQRNVLYLQDMENGAEI